MAVQNTQRQTTHAKHDLKAWMATLLQSALSQALTSCCPTSSKLEIEPQCHHRLPIPQRIVNAGHKGYQ